MAYNSPKALPPGAASCVFNNEKQQMQSLNDRLAQYLQKISEMKFCASAGMSISYKEVMKQIEAYILNIKTVYEAYINKLRHQLDKKDNNKPGGSKVYEETQIKLSVEMKKAKKLEMEVKALEKTLADRDRELADAKSSLRRLEAELGTAQQTSHEVTVLNKKLTEQSAVKKGYSAKLRKVEEQHQFEMNKHNAHASEMQKRIQVANEIIASLELKLKQFKGWGINLPIIIQKMREGNLVEMKKFQVETEAALSKTMAALKSEVSGRCETREKMSQELMHMEQSVRRLTAEKAELEAKMKGLVSENESLRVELEHDRGRSQMVISKLEKKLTMLQETIMTSTWNFANAREAQLSLKTEIETYQKLLDSELYRLKTPARCGTSAGHQCYNGFVVHQKPGTDQALPNFDFPSLPGSPRLRSPSRMTSRSRMSSRMSTRSNLCRR